MYFPVNDHNDLHQLFGNITCKASTYIFIIKRFTNASIINLCQFNPIYNSPNNNFFPRPKRRGEICKL